MNQQSKRFTLNALRLSLTLGWLYPDLMSIYGDRGNIICLTKRCEWRGITAVVKPITIASSASDITSLDLVFGGGAQDSQQTIVYKDLKEKKGTYLKKVIDNGTPGLYICGAYQLLGNYYKEADGKIIEGLGIFDFSTENPGPDKKRLIGNTVADISALLPEAAVKTIVGFENHGGRTYLGEGIKPLAKIIKGYGNNDEDSTEGAHYKNSFGSYFHGPILPKNPHLADYLITLALEKKYKEKIALEQLDDTLAWQAHTAILNKISK